MRKIKCHLCGYEWETKSEMKYVTCPSCYSKINTQRKKDVE